MSDSRQTKVIVDEQRRIKVSLSTLFNGNAVLFDDDEDAPLIEIQFYNQMDRLSKVHRLQCLEAVYKELLRQETEGEET